MEVLWSTMMKAIAKRSEIQGTFMPASWYHMVIGYDAGYYGYLYSEVFAYSLLDEFKSCSGGNVINPTLGMKYRKCILEPGASVDGFDMLENFLGRKPDSNAFFKALGI
eukprot:CAMPEP_0204890144 /NCGR_PEP_ID=MMETSP1349-20130617/24420_1 /ASSEMBLY_ACC=CAM_ASM_000710 /TAXON_ID=215587 /ORGANISM="Aplanochytrium stocchinoi, Strain GSBS06" /LENGTH=108 /DNA_ID=CAMNT_0052054685 /DNA_START=9 /DNA_END=335 /DNA_ORIENTATION=-